MQEWGQAMRCENVITIYNVVRGQEGGSMFYPTVFSCHLEEAEGKTHSDAYEHDSDAFSAFIPFTAEEEVGKFYMSPEAYERAEWKERLFTFKHGDIVLKGVHTEEIESEKAFVMKYPEAVRVQSVDTYDFGSMSMRHWEVHCG